MGKYDKPNLVKAARMIDPKVKEMDVSALLCGMAADGHFLEDPDQMPKYRETWHEVFAENMVNGHYVALDGTYTKPGWNDDADAWWFTVLYDDKYIQVQAGALEDEDIPAEFLDRIQAVLARAKRDKTDRSDILIHREPDYIDCFRHTAQAVFVLTEKEWNGSEFTAVFEDFLDAVEQMKEDMRIAAGDDWKTYEQLFHEKKNEYAKWCVQRKRFSVTHEGKMTTFRVEMHRVVQRQTKKE